MLGDLRDEVLGNGLYAADHYEDALSVQVADLAIVRRVGAPEYNILLAQANHAHVCTSLDDLDRGPAR